MIMANNVLMLVTLALGWSSVLTLPTRPISAAKSGNDSWDHFIFVQQYPAGVCSHYESKGNSSTCFYPANATSWTIHGLWPTLGDTKGPNTCNTSATFNINRIKDLVPRLSTEWTNLLSNTPVDSFWEHEWLKHGTCSDITDEHTYFSIILDYFEKMQFGNLLQDQGIVPQEEKEYSVNDILEALNTELGAYPYHILCEYSKKTGTILTQIGVCLDKEMKVMDCPSPTSVYSCRGKMYYPTSLYHH